jgi:ABC-type antimicrobial peptide transport system permease subunit
MSLAIRAAGEPRELIAAVVREVRALDPDLPVFAVATMDEMIASSTSVFLRRLPLQLMGAFAGVCLLLAIVGIVGVVSYDVMQRAREIGIRMALGAERRHVLRLVMGQGLGMAVAGVGIGALLAFGGSRVLRTLLFEVEMADAAVYLACGLLLVAVAAAASYVPARRATRVEPVTVLRAE